MSQANPDRAIPQEIIDQFRSIDTACIADALHGLRLSCIVQGISPLRRGMKICGPAATMRHIPIQDLRQFESQEMGVGTFITQLCKPGDVVVIDVGGRVDAAPVGSNVARLAKRNGIEGIVIDGACRDSEEIVETGLATFVRGTCALHPHGLMRTTCINSEPVQLGSGPRATSVGPGDLVIGDADAIVVVPVAWAPEVLVRAQERHAIDIGELADPGRERWKHIYGLKFD